MLVHSGKDIDARRAWTAFSLKANVAEQQGMKRVACYTFAHIPSLLYCRSMSNAYHHYKKLGAGGGNRVSLQHVCDDYVFVAVLAIKCAPQKKKQYQKGTMQLVRAQCSPLGSSKDDGRL